MVKVVFDDGPFEKGYQKRTDIPYTGVTTTTRGVADHKHRLLEGFMPQVTGHAS